MTSIIKLHMMFIFSLGTAISAQDVAELRIVEIPSEYPSEVCFNLDIKAVEHEFELSTQNYRLYYDASGLRFLRHQTKSFLAADHFLKPKLMQAIHDSDGSGFGSLEFGNHLGFINLIINHQERAQGQKVGINEWQTTTSLCFAKTGESRSIVWARKDLTAGYASAYTSVASIFNLELSEIAIAKYHDYSNLPNAALPRLNETTTNKNH